MSHFLNDIKYALRQLKKNPGFAMTVVVMLALGIGLNTMVFAIVHGALYKPLSVPNGVDLVTVCGKHRERGRSSLKVSYPDFVHFRQRNSSFADLEALASSQTVMGDRDHPARPVHLARVTDGFLAMLRTTPALGRAFSVEDSRRDSEPVIVLGHALWQRHYQADPSVIGRIVRCNGQPTTIIGVMPPDFEFPAGVDCWIPLVPDSRLETRSRRPLSVFGVLAPGTSMAEAKAEIATIGQQLSATFPDTNKDIAATVRTLREAQGTESDLRVVFFIMMVAVGSVLLIACCNVASMMLSRMIQRRPELSLRAAMGAPRWHLMRQLLIESVTLSLLGGLLGLGLAVYGIHLVDVATLDKRSAWTEFSLDARVFAFFAVVSVLSGVVFGLVPALRASRVNLNSVLAHGTRLIGGRDRGRLAGGLVVAQFAMTVVLLASTGLMVRSVLTAQSTNDFVPAEQILSAHLRLPAGQDERYAEPEDRRRFHGELVRRLSALPGVTHAATGSSVPGFEDNDVRAIEIEGHTRPASAQAEEAIFNTQTSSFLSLIGLPMLEGRDLQEADETSGHPVAVVTRRFAARHWPEQSALGKRFRSVSDAGPGRWLSVVGIAADIVANTQGQTLPVVFLPYRETIPSHLLVLLRVANDPHSHGQSMRTVVQGLDQDLPLFSVRTLQATKARNHSDLVIFGSLFAAFALTALLMASGGIYAVVAQTTGNRIREIAVRMALGATTVGIYRLVLSRGLRQLTAGLVIGLLGALASTRLLEGNLLLTSVSAQDPLVFAIVVMFLLCIGLFACWLPARRAARVDPMEALRYE